MFVIAQKSVPAVFLNCTKNTELTNARFARTVSLALTNISLRSTCASRLAVASTGAHRQPMHSGQRHMKSEEWKTYRTRFLVKSKQLTSSLTFVDHLGRQHCGRKGDYLVESFDGVLSIAPRRIFEDIYVLMCPQEMSSKEMSPLAIYSDESRGGPTVAPTPNRQTLPPPELDGGNFEALDIAEVKFAKPTSFRRRRDDAPPVGELETSRGRRKLPQPCRVRPSGTRLGLM
jgi:hypothetical protein